MENLKYIEVLKAIPLPCALIKIDNVGFKIVVVNKKLLELTDLKEEELLGKYICSTFQPKSSVFSSKKIQESLLEVKNTGNSNTVLFETEPQKEKILKEKKYWEIISTRVAEDKNYVLQTLRDVTSQVFQEKNEKQIKEQLLQKEQEFNHFIEKNPDGLYSLDLKGNFTSANNGITEIAEVPLGELLKMSFLPFCSDKDKDKILKHFYKAIHGESNNFEAEFVSAKGRKMILGISLMPINIEGKIVGVYGISKDLTQIRNTEKIVVQKDKLLRANASFINAILKSKLHSQALKEAFRLIGETVSVDRMYYFEVHLNKGNKERFISQKIEWTSKVASAQIDNPEMQNLPVKKLPEIMEFLMKEEPFKANLNEVPEGELKQIFIDQDIKSMLLLPIFMSNKLHGFIGFDDCKNQRVWSNAEITFLKSLAQNLKSAFEKRIAEEKLEEREEELKRSEQKFRALVQEGSDLMAIIDFSGNYKFVSDTINSILGIAPYELVGKNVFELIHPDDKDLVKKKFLELQKTSQIKLGPFRFLGKNGNWHWLECTATNLLNDPAVGGIVTNSRDITTILKQAQEIEYVNKRYRLAARAAHDIIYEWDLNTNKSFRYYGTENEFFGFPVDQIVEIDAWMAQIHPQDIKAVKSTIKRETENNQKRDINTSYRFKRADGTYATLIDRAYIVRDDNGKAERLIGAAMDISEIISKEEKIKEVNQRYKLAIKATNEMIWDWNIKTNKIIRSTTFKDIYGYKIEDDYPPNSFWFSKTHPKDQKRVMKSFNAAIQKKKQMYWKEEYCVYKANGEIAHVIDRASILRDEKGQATRMVGAVLDVTESRKLLNKIQEQNQTLKEIAWEQSHVVRAPLARLKGLLQMLELSEFEEISKEEILENISFSADELDSIVRKIVAKAEKIGLEQEK